MHNPDKNRALCVLSKTVRYGFPAIGIIALIILIGLIVLIFSSLWQGFGVLVWGIFKVAIVMGTMILIVWAAISLYEWAKRYSNNC